MVLLTCALAYLTGIVAGRLAWQAGLIGCDFPAWLWLAFLALLPLTPLLKTFSPPVVNQTMRWPQQAGFVPPGRSPWRAAMWAALALCAMAGLARFAAHPLTPCWTPSDLAYYNLPAARAFDQDAPQVTVTGYVSSYPLVSDGKQRLHVRVDARLEDGVAQPVTGTLRLSTGTRSRFRYGQPVRLRGRLVTPPQFEDFAYADYLARKGVFSLLYGAQIDPQPGPTRGNPVNRVLYALRARGEAVLNRLLPEPYAALANGMLLGIEAGIPDDLYDQFNLTGTSHVIVISGSNVALIAAVFAAVGTRLLGRRRAVYPALLGIAAFALLVGGDAAVLRAALMGGLFVHATALGRRSTALVSLALACWIMTLLNPLTLWDVGFQLSSAATAGLILFSPAITAAFERFVSRFRRPATLPVIPPEPVMESPVAGVAASSKVALRSLIQDGLLITIAANITTLPLVVFYFGRLSLVSLLTNLLIAPVQPLIMLWGSAGVLAGAAGLMWPARLLLLAPWLSLVWTVRMVEWTAALPGASLEIAHYGLGGLLMTYGLIFAVTQRRTLMTRAKALGQIDRSWLQSHLVGPATAGLLSVAAVVIWAAALTQPDGRLHVHFLDIGQGDGILIQTPSGRQVLIDGGLSPQTLFSELGAVMPFWDRHLDMVLLTHPDGDHMAAQIDVPARFAVDQALDTSVSQANPDAQPWRDALAAAGATVHIDAAGGWIDLGDGVALWVLWPPPDGFAHEHADNENSLVVKLVYGAFSALLTGDAGLPAEAEWLRRGTPIQATVLKVGHHGSKSGSSPEFIRAVDPALAVIQVGAENSYGHPHAEVLATLDGRMVLRTDQAGRIHVSSDGQTMRVEHAR